MSQGKPDTPAAPKSPAKAENSNEDLMQAHRDSLTAVQDLAYTMTRQASKPVEVTVAPSELHLTIAPEANKPTRSIRVKRGEDGKVTGMEFVEPEAVNDD